jgi:hypothetical protein
VLQAVAINSRNVKKSGKKHLWAHDSQTAHSHSLAKSIWTAAPSLASLLYQASELVSKRSFSDRWTEIQPPGVELFLRHPQSGDEVNGLERLAIAACQKTRKEPAVN